MASGHAGEDLDALIASGPWQMLREGVEVQYLHRREHEPVAALLRYQPGARIPAHRHTGVEFVQILYGTQRDADGIYGAGNFKANVAGSVHEVVSDDGCVVLIIWTASIEFLSDA
jgi:anti-sigma factor ChrR (cupin superfamily)